MMACGTGKSRPRATMYYHKRHHLSQMRWAVDDDSCEGFRSFDQSVGPVEHLLTHTPTTFTMRCFEGRTS
jgi:hypothetical protein